ncbi:ABC transporter permease subunit [Alphaproteobacteria bacterium GH1-50]|uniref:ABC transporter permease subunit n=1 Tax=Kangsaoukella pontilimi TaxID=2691042 RepID=A0A7C9MQ63_9RHOB|nr:amino acid ABC transporter permease [Kangsaoukella pontilimi]MXQ07117.1 ABC transporter permease subunit [Kangsaoukella pontilimi]
MFNYNFQWRPVWRSLPDLFEASLVTLQVAALAIVLGILVGLVLALVRMNMRGPARWIATAWVELARNTPVLFQLFFFGFGLGAFGWHLTPFTIVLVGLTFNSAGYLAENFRGGFNAIPDTQLRAARSLGMTAWQAYTRVVIPQVFRLVYHPITNQMVWAVLMSSLGMLVGFRELSGETQFLASRSYRIFEYFAVTAVIYFVIVKIILLVSRLLAMRLFRY